MWGGNFLLQSFRRVFYRVYYDLIIQFLITSNNGPIVVTSGFRP